MDSVRALGMKSVKDLDRESVSAGVRSSVRAFLSYRVRG